MTRNIKEINDKYNKLTANNNNYNNDTTIGKTKCAVWEFCDNALKIKHIFVTDFHLDIMGVNTPTTLAKKGILNYNLLKDIVAENAERTPGIKTYFIPSMQMVDGYPARSFCTVWREENAGNLEPVDAYVHHWQ
jgi:hypothetical protein